MKIKVASLLLFILFSSLSCFGQTAKTVPARDIDFTKEATPPNPVAGIDRFFIDNSDVAHILQSNGTVTNILSSASNVAFTDVANIFIQPQTIRINNLLETDTEGLRLKNTTLSTNPDPVQQAPGILSVGHGWDGILDHEYSGLLIFNPSNSGVPSEQAFYFKTDAGAYTPGGYITEDGRVCAATGFDLPFLPVALGEVLRYDGTRFVNYALASTDLSDAINIALYDGLQGSNGVSYDGGGNFSFDFLYTPGFARTSITGRLRTTPIDHPTISPTTALAGLGAGNLSNGIYKYKLTWITNVGLFPSFVVSETDPSIASAGTTVTDFTTDGQISLSIILNSPNPYGIAKKLYRTAANGSTYKFLADLTQFQTTYIDNIADADLGVDAPTLNTSAGLELAGALSGSNLFLSPRIAGDQTYILPTGYPAGNGYSLASTADGVMSWVAPVTPFDPASPGAIGGTTPAQGDFTKIGINRGVTAFITSQQRLLINPYTSNLGNETSTASITSNDINDTPLILQTVDGNLAQLFQILNANGSPAFVINADRSLSFQTEFASYTNNGVSTITFTGTFNGWTDLVDYTGIRPGSDTIRKGIIQATDRGSLNRFAVSSINTQITDWSILNGNLPVPTGGTLAEIIVMPGGPNTVGLRVTGGLAAFDGGASSTIFNATTGYQVGGAAASGNYLRGNGTNFVSSAIQAGDIPSLSATYALLTANTFTGNQTLADANLISIQTTAPTISTAGTSASVTAGSTDEAGSISIVGTAFTGSSTLSFNLSHSGAPKSVVFTATNATAGALSMPVNSSKTATGFVIDLIGLTGTATLNYECRF